MSKVTLTELTDKYSQVVAIKQRRNALNLDYINVRNEFDALTNKASQKILAKFMREANIFID